jgi:S1-C subfamily serine protease
MQTALSQLSDHLAELVERVSASTVLVSARPRFTSSGVIWAPGVVVTADHTIQHDEVTVRLPGGEEAQATLAGRDRATDIAVLRVDTGVLPPRFTNPDTLKAGQLALTVGRTEQGVTATMGIVSTVSGPWRTWRGGLIDRFIRLDLALYPSSSGAAVADGNGDVFAIATSGLSRTSAIAIPKVTVDLVVDELLRRGRIARGYLGVGLQPVPLPAHLKNKLSLSQEGGVIVLSVEPDGPAETAGLTIGDVVLELKGQPVADTDDMQSALGSAAVGDPVELRVLRGGEVKTLTVTLGERPRKE